MTEAGMNWRGRGVVRGAASGPALISRTPLSFLGDIDIRSGRVVGKSSDLRGASVAGSVLLVPATRGSAGAWRFLYQLKVHGAHPAALVARETPDPSVVQGAILAEIPIVVIAGDELWRAAEGRLLHVDGGAGLVTASG